MLRGSQAIVISEGLRRLPVTAPYRQRPRDKPPTPPKSPTPSPTCSPGTSVTTSSERGQIKPRNPQRGQRCLDEEPGVEFTAAGYFQRQRLRLRRRSDHRPKVTQIPKPPTKFSDRSSPDH
jgi:hypothetical protein